MVAGNASGLYWLQFKRPDLMTSATFAVTPAHWSKFDRNGCWWATDIAHAERIAQWWGAECMIWRVPARGSAYRWMRAGQSLTPADRLDQIADLVMGA